MPIVSSHSCKETVLAWMARFGADKPTLDLLGRHVGSITSSDIYARGMQSRPLRKLSLALISIRAGTFLPDETRSGLFRDAAESSPLPSASSFQAPIASLFDQKLRAVAGDEGPGSSDHEGSLPLIPSPGRLGPVAPSRADW